MALTDWKDDLRKFLGVSPRTDKVITREEFEEGVNQCCNVVANLVVNCHSKRDEEELVKELDKIMALQSRN